MRIGIVTREWPPDVYGGAGVHIEHLVAAMRSLPSAAADAADGGLTVDVHCFGSPRPDATAHAVPANLRGANGALQAVGVDVEIAAALGEADLVHSHTWYANTAGLLASLVHGAPHVVTAHSLEPRRPLPRHDPDAHGVTLGGGTARARRANAPFTGYVASHAWRSSGARHRAGGWCGEAACPPHR